MRADVGPQEPRPSPTAGVAHLSRDTPETVYKKAKGVNTPGSVFCSSATLPSRVLATNNYKTQRLAMFREVTGRQAKVESGTQGTI